MTPSQMLAAARTLLSRSDSATAGLWPRAAALLGRQALEATLAEMWKIRAPDVERCSMRAQLICLPTYLDHQLAGRASFTWAMLSSACHPHAYELAPTASELTRWLNTCDELVSAVHAER